MRVPDKQYFLISAIMLRLLLMLAVVFGQCAIYTAAHYEGAKTLYGEKKLSGGKTMFLNSDSVPTQEEQLARVRRDAPQPQPLLTNSTVKMKVCIQRNCLLFFLLMLQ